MALSNDPSLLFGTSGNLLGLTTLNNYPTAPSSVNFLLNCSQILGAYLQIWSLGGPSVSGGATTNISIYSTPDNVWFDTNPYIGPYSITNIASTISRQSFWVDFGSYQVSITNTDLQNPINVMATTGIGI